MLIVATGGGTAAAYAYLHARPVTDKTSARCYTVPVYTPGFPFPGTTVASASGGGDAPLIQDALDACDPHREHDWLALKLRRDAYIARLNEIYARNLESREVELIRGTAEFVDARTLDVNGRRITAQHTSYQHVCRGVKEKTFIG